jgi:hypothetical protein
MREIVAQDVVPDQVPCIAELSLKPIQRRCHFSLLAPNGGGLAKAYRRQIENPRCFWVDFEVDGQALRQEWVRMLDGF